MIADFDSFDSYRTANIPQKWTAYTSAASISLGTGRCGTNCLQVTPSPGSGGVLKGFTMLGPTFQFGAAHYFVPGGFSGFNLYTLYHGSTPIVSISRTIAGGIQWVINPDAAFPTTAFVSNGGWLPYSEWNHLSMAGTLSTTSAEVVFKLNGIEVQRATFQTCSPFDTPLFNAIFLCSGGFTNTQRYDDFFVGDLTGTYNNTQLGDVHVQKMTLQADGTPLDFSVVGGGTAHYSAVEDGDNPDTTRGIESDTAGITDVYQVEQLADVGGTNVYAVKVSMLAQKDYPGDRSLGVVVSDGSVHDAGVSLPISQSTYRYAETIMEADPATGAQWTLAGYNAHPNLGPRVET